MATAELINTCPACGAEEGLDNLLVRMIDDDDARRLIADVITTSVPVGGMVVRYLRLHKPPKQKLRMKRVREVLAELVPDILRAEVERKGRHWHAPLEAWQRAFEAVFDAHAKGRLRLPLPDNAYLYEVLLRQADRAEGAQEREVHEAARHRVTNAVQRVDDSLQQLDGALHQAAAPSAPPVAPPTAPAPVYRESPTVRQMKAGIAAARARQEPQPPEEPQP